MKDVRPRERYKDPEEGLTAKQKAKFRVAGFVRRRKYDILRGQGLAPEESVRRLGIKIPHGITLKIDEVLRKIERGR